MKLAQILLASTKQLQKITDQPAWEAELLLAFILKKDRAWVLAHNRSMTNDELRIMNVLLKRRLSGEPLAYLLGEWEFYGWPFKVNKNVLIPRPESEKLVDLVATTTDPLPTSQTIIIDVGTGSGCLAIAIARINNEKLKINNTKIFAIDISAKALTVAKHNAKLNQVDRQITFLRGNLLEPIIKNSVIKNLLKIQNYPPASLSEALRAGKFKIIANLPYLKTSLPGLSQKQKIALSYEPATALLAGADGLKYYKILAEQIKNILQHYPQLSIELYCEADPDQMSRLQKLFNNAQTKIIKDFRRQNRFIRLSFPPEQVRKESRVKH